MTPASAVALLAAFCAGIFFILASLVPRRSESPTAASAGVPIIGPPPDIYWPVMLGTGERTLEPHLRLEVIHELGELNDAWSGAILRCALEQERDPAIAAAIRAALAR